MPAWPAVVTASCLPVYEAIYRFSNCATGCSDASAYTMAVPGVTVNAPAPVCCMLTGAGITAGASSLCACKKQGRRARSSNVYNFMRRRFLYLRQAFVNGGAMIRKGWDLGADGALCFLMGRMME